MKLKRGADVLKGCMYKMSDDTLEIPIFFENADRHFESNNTEDYLRLPLINPYLSDKARRLITRLAIEETDTYEKLKKALMKEFKLTPLKYKDMFDRAFKEKSESYVQFATRLTVIWKYYMDSRDINKSFEKLCELIVADKFKGLLPPNAKEFLRTKEGEDWNPVQQIARMVDTYVDSYPESRGREETRGREENRGNNFNRFRQERSKSVTDVERNRQDKNWRSDKTETGKSSDNRGTDKRNENDTRPKCWNCGMLGHVSKYCKKSLNTNRSNNGQTKKVYQLTVCDEPDQTQNTETSDSDQNQNSENTGEEQTETVYHLVGADSKAHELIDKIQKESESKIIHSSEIPLPEDNTTWLNFGGKDIKAVFDSGTSITVVNERCIPKKFLRNIQEQNKIELQTFTGQKTPALLVDIPCIKASVKRLGFESYVMLTCAVVPRDFRIDCLLSLADYRFMYQAEENLAKRKMPELFKVFQAERILAKSKMPGLSNT